MTNLTLILYHATAKLYNNKKPHKSKEIKIDFFYLHTYLFVFSVCLNRTRVYNKHILENAVANRPAGIPLLTVSNHHSCFDDPGIWGVLDLNLVCNKNVIRWSMAAHDICFTNKYHSLVSCSYS